MIDLYPVFRERFADALDPAWQDIAEIDAKVARGECLMWAYGETAVICEVRELPMGPVLFGLACVGDKGELTGRIKPAVEWWANEAGCKGIAFCGRTGWARALPDYKVIQVVALKEL